MLRLGVYKFPSAEDAVIQTIIRLYASDLGFSWRVVTVPPYDALLVDGSVDPDEIPACGTPEAVLRITQMHSGDCFQAMARPIRADKLHKWLKGIECGLRRSEAVLDIRWSDMPLEVEASESAWYTLRRWPSALLLRHDADNVRMATLLSRRALNAGGLARYSRLPLSRCVLYLQTLKAAGYLEARADPEKGGLERSSTAGAQIAPRRSMLASGLVSRIRRHLGLGAA